MYIFMPAQVFIRREFKNPRRISLALWKRPLDHGIAWTLHLNFLQTANRLLPKKARTESADI